MAKSNLNSPDAKSRRPRSDQAERAAPLSNRPHQPAGERSETLRASEPAAWIRPERSDIFIFLILVVLTAAVYWPVRGFLFINYDDADYVSENVRVQAGLTIGNVVWAFRTMYFSNWHPLTWLSYMLDCQLFGLNAGAFHLVNALFHLLTSLLLFAVFKRMTGARWPSA